ncbi:MAG: sugar phosphate isomerase/epimerase [Candidatus Omnitrophica bacterium]|nr:sugar phosphate isomerase/epimerase [Candidatus Omnitrophota bacterium]
MTNIFKLAVSTFIFEDKPLSLKELKQIKEAGFSLIEVWGRKPHFDFTNPKAVKKIKSSINSLGIKVASFHAPFGEAYDLSSCDKDIRRGAVKEIIHSAEVLEELGGARLIIHGGIRVNEGENRQPLISNLKTSLEEILKICEGKKKVLVLENMLPGRVGDTAEEVWEIANSFKSIYIGICLDTGHANIGGDLIETIKKFQSRLVTLHVSDNSGERDDHHLPGEGSINWPEFLAALAQGSYDGPFMYELVKREDNLAILRKAKSIYGKFKAIFKENLVW